MSQTEWSLFEALVRLLDAVGLMGALALIVAAFATGRIVRGSELEAEREEHARTRSDRDRWVSVALRGMGSAEVSTSLAEKVIPSMEETP